MIDAVIRSALVDEALQAGLRGRLDDMRERLSPLKPARGSAAVAAGMKPPPMTPAITAALHSKRHITLLHEPLAQDGISATLTRVEPYWLRQLSTPQCCRSHLLQAEKTATHRNPI